MSRIQIIIVTLLLPSLAGCTSLQHWYYNGFKVGPDYKRPIVPVAADWIDSDNPSIVFHQQAQTDWWRVFNDPILEQLIQAAYQQNLPLRVAGLRVLEARTQRSITAANLFPQSQAGFGQYSRTQLSQTIATGAPGLPRVFDDWQTGFDMSWEIDVWGRLRRSIEASDATIDSEIENYDDILVTLIGDVAATYFELRSFDERIGLAEKNAEFQKDSLELAQKRFDAGQVSNLDVQQATSNLADTRALIPSLKLGRRLALNRLAILLGTTPYALEPVLSKRGTLPNTPAEVVVGIPCELLRRRPDIRDAERQIARQSAQIGIAEAELYPQFGLNGEIKLNSENFSDLFSSASSAGFVAPGFRWKILNYGRLVNNVQVQELRFQQAIVEYEDVVLAAHREVEDAMVQFLRSKERAVELQKSAEAASKSVELVRSQYEEGLTDFGRVFVLEASLVVAQDNLIATQGDVAIALARVYKALGGGWQLRNTVPYRGCYSIEAIVNSDSQFPVEIDPHQHIDENKELPAPLPSSPDMDLPNNGSFEDS